MRHSCFDSYRYAVSQARAHLVLALLAGSVCSAAATVLEPPCEPPCDLPPCTTVDVGPFSQQSHWKFVPDRRPLAVIATFNGTPTNDIGLAEWWYDNDLEDPCGDGTPGVGTEPLVIERLLAEMDRLYGNGFRRIQLRMPAGKLTQPGLFDSSQWHTMPAWRRDAFESAIAAWIADKVLNNDPVTFSINGGYEINDPCEFGMEGSHAPDPSDSGDMCTFNRNLQPWINVGATEYWFDASAGKWPAMHEIQHSTDYLGNLRFIGEALPMSTASCASPGLPVRTAIENGAFGALFSFIHTNIATTFVADDTTTELGMLLSGHEVECEAHPDNGARWTFAQATDYYNRNFVLWAQSHVSPTDQHTPSPHAIPSTTYSFDYPFRFTEEAVHRIYSFGPLVAMLDMNNDGLIEVSRNTGADYSLFITAYLANSGSPGGYLDGDVNGDGFVDVIDFLDFIDAMSQWNASGTVVGTNLGDPWWVP